MKDLTSLRAAAEDLVGLKFVLSAVWYEWVDLANPATVLELLDRLEAAEARAQDCDQQWGLASTAHQKADSALTASQARAGELDGALQGLVDASPHLIIKAVRKPEDRFGLGDWTAAMTKARAALTGGGGEGFRSARDHAPDTCAATPESAAKEDYIATLATYGDGSWVALESYAGGAHKLGAWGELRLAIHDASGETIIRRYVADATPEGPAFQERAKGVEP